MSSLSGPVAKSSFTIESLISLVREFSRKLTQQEILDEQIKNFYKIALLEVGALLNGTLNPSYMTYEESSIVKIGKDEADALRNYYSFDLEFANGVKIDRIVSATIKAVKTDSSTNPPTVSNLGRFPVKLVNPSEYVSIFANSAGTSLYSSTIVGSQFKNRFKTDYSTSTDESTLPPKDAFNVIIGKDIWDSIKPLTASQTLDLKLELYFLRQPAISFANTTESVDLPDKYVPLLVKRMYSYCLLQTQGDIPTNFANEMASDYRQIAEFINADFLSKGLTQAQNERR